MKSLTQLFCLISILCVLFVAGNVFAVGLDPTFGTGGKTYTSVSQTSSHGNAVLVQPDGKYLVAGYRGSGLNAPEAQLIRYNSDGTPDTSFGTAGVKYWGIQITSLQVTGAALQADGKIVMVGPGAFSGFQIFRVMPDGTPDTSFGPAGRVVIAVGNSAEAFAVVVQSSGKIVVGGHRFAPGNTANDEVVLVRLNAVGTTDNSFGPNGNGMVVGPAGACTTLVQHSNGSLISDLSGDVHGTLPSYGSGQITTARFSGDGVLDSSFGVGGVARVSVGTAEKTFAAAVQPDGKIVAVGSTQFSIYSNPPSLASDWAIVRFNQDGTPDNSFGLGGKLTLSFAYRNLDEIADAVAVQPDGKILVGGHTYYGGGVLVRLSSTGGVLGKTDVSGVHDPGRFVSTPRFIMVQTDGKIVVAGDSVTDLGDAVGIARYLDITSINNSSISYDYDGDQRAEISVYRAGATSAADSFWYGYWSTNISVSGADSHFFSPSFGLGQDIPVPGDYTGDHRADFAVFRPSTGTWYNSISYELGVGTNFTSVQWGQAGDIPAPGDFDGDGITDRAVFRPSTGAWYILNSTGGYVGVQFGISGDKPVAADYDNDGRVDIAVVRNIGGQLYWFILQSSDGAFVSIPFGITGDRLVPTDFDGDGRAEIAVFRGSTGAWYVLRNYSTFSAVSFGTNGDVPAPADYDGDGINDYAVFRPSNQGYYILNSHDGSLTSQQFGISTDLPLASAYVR